MITRLRIQNYKCFEDLTVEFGRLNLLIGGNGSGKSTVLEVLDLLRQLLCEGEKVGTLFPSSSLNYSKREFLGDRVQVLELELEAKDQSHRYEVRVEHHAESREVRIVGETYRLAEEVVFEYEQDSGHMALRNGSAFQYTSDGRRSPLEVIAHSNSDSRVHDFLVLLHGFYTHHLVPERMSSEAGEPASRLHMDGSNFASWYHSMEKLTIYGDVDSRFESYLNALRDAIPGFKNLYLSSVPKTERVLAFAELGGENRIMAYCSLDDLSDGQRALLVLHAIRHFLVQRTMVIGIDEPDNYIALTEIQPWLDAMNDASDETGAQLIFTSHHPEMLNRWAMDYGILFERDELGMATCRRYVHSPNSGISPAEAIARG